MTPRHPTNFHFNVIFLGIFKDYELHYYYPYILFTRSVHNPDDITLYRSNLYTGTNEVVIQEALKRANQLLLPLQSPIL